MNAETVRIALVGDFNAAVIAHQAIPVALARAADELGVSVTPTWIPTTTPWLRMEEILAGCSGIWCVPGSPYASTEAALAAIRYAREAPRPFCGTCGGFQHAVLEYARNGVGLRSAAHAESEPDALDPLITPLACPLIEQRGEISLLPGSRLATLYGAATIAEEYHCSYGIAPKFEPRVCRGALHVTGRDAAGQVRAIELDGHPFFVATLFQPERAALKGTTPPIVRGLVRAATAVQ